MEYENGKGLSMTDVNKDTGRATNRKLYGCQFYETRSCKGCTYNSVPYAHVGTCTLISDNGKSNRADKAKWLKPL